jgi:hypothetical protein
VNTQDPNPYATPSFVDEVVNYGSVEMARRSLSRPATAIVIMASVHSVFDSIRIMEVMMTAVQPAANGTSVLLFIMLIAFFSLHVFQSICAAKMGKLESFPMAQAGCLLCIIPVLSPFYFLGIPFGVWGWMLLRRPAIRQAFEERQIEATRKEPSSSNFVA